MVYFISQLYLDLALEVVASLEEEPYNLVASFDFHNMVDQSF
jgi:hypothetical protein